MNPILLAAWPSGSVVLIREGQNIPIHCMGQGGANHRVRTVLGTNGIKYTLVDTDDIGVLN
jgi:hypothetical protein